MEKEFDLFARILPGVGAAVSVVALPEYTAFGPDLMQARSDLARTLSRALSEGRLQPWTETHWDSLALVRLELEVRALQGERLLPVPMRFSVLHRKRGKSAGERWTVEVPRLDLTFHLRRLEDLKIFAEEEIRHALHLSPLSELLAAAYQGEERIERLTVRPRGALQSETKEARTPDDKSAPILPQILRDVCTDLCEEARLGLLGRAYEREAELLRLRADLAERRSVALIGPSGAGKTAIIHELVQRTLQAPPGSPLKKHGFFATSGSRIVAGMRFLGEWQARAEALLAELRSRPSVLVVESLTELLETGDSKSGLDLASYLVPAVEGGELVLLLEATREDLARAQRSHPALVHALRPLEVAPLSPIRANRALSTAARRIERLRRIRLPNETIEQATALAQRFDAESALPGSAIRLLEEASARESPPEGQPPKTVSTGQVIEAFSVRSGYPRRLIDPSVAFSSKEILGLLEGRVIGQPVATRLMADLVVTLRAGLLEGQRPLGSFLLLGPSGVGKTESAKALSELFFGDEKRMVRFDMGEFVAPGSAHRLVSAEDGSLVSRVRQTPFGVVLLDEIEKADGGVHDLLLQVLGDGRLSDCFGRTVSFRNTVVFLTSNLGAESRRSLGFGALSASGFEQQYLSAAAAFFRPELINRIDHVVPYAALSEASIRTITDRVVKRALSREGLERRGIKVDVDATLFNFLIDQGFDPRYGARPLERAVERHLVVPLARALAELRYSEGAGHHRWKVVVKDGVSQVLTE